MYTCLKQIKAYYDDGFKCIRYEQNQNGELVIYLKNFESEDIETLYCVDKQEMNEIRDFIDINWKILSHRYLSNSNIII